MSDASEVKRWWVNGFDITYQPIEHEVWTVFFTEFDPGRKEAFQVMPVEDHDRIMAERDELWKRATKFVMPGEMDTGESIEHYIKTLEQTIAAQARVIEKLKERLTSWISETHPNDEHLRNMCLMVEERELAAIEKEGEEK